MQRELNITTLSMTGKSVLTYSDQLRPTIEEREVVMEEDIVREEWRSPSV